MNAARPLADEDLHRIELCLPPDDGESRVTVELGAHGDPPTARFDTDDVRALVTEVRRLRAEHRPETAPLTKPLAGVKVVAVDDDSDTLDMVAWILKRVGASVETFAAADAALERFEHMPWPDILVSDVAMPHHDGLWLIRQIRSTDLGKRFPALAMSAHAGSNDKAHALDAGFGMHLAKPVIPEELVAAVMALLAQRVPLGT